MKYDGPIVLAVLDGVGLTQEKRGNALYQAHADFLKNAIKNYPMVRLDASGEAVGILPGDMGNSEVGHNALGSGQIVRQGIAEIEEAFSNGNIWQSEAWQGAIKNVLEHNSTLHFAGIFSDGNVHSNISHLARMISQANKEGVKKIRIHLVLDGRDVPPQSAEKYIAACEEYLARFKDCDYKIASGGGRMVFVADRYENDWNVVKAGWDAMVLGQAPHQFARAMGAINYFRNRNMGAQDQYIPPFVITSEDQQPVGLVKEGDSFIYYDFRADRAIEIAQAFTYDDFPHFDRQIDHRKIYFVGMTEYNSDLHVPEHQLVPPVKIAGTLHEFLGKRGISQLAVAETVKYGHITYYFNGNSYELAPGEEEIEIPSDTLPFNTRPWMKSAEVADAVLERLDQFDLVRCNFAACDMVGHFGEMEPAIVAVEAIDLQLARLAKRVDELGGMMIITADHGNVEEILDKNGKPKTAHSTNLVPCIFYDNTSNAHRYRVTKPEHPGLANVAATVATLLGQSDLPENWQPSLISLVKSE